MSDVLDLFAAGLSAEEVLEELPDLELDDLKASARWRQIAKTIRKHQKG